MASSNFPGRPFRLEEGVYVYQQNSWNTGNNTLIHSELWVRKNSYSPTWAASGGSYSMYVAGTLVGANGNFGYDFRNSDEMLLHASNNWFQNDGNGNLWVASDGYANMGALGATEVHGGIWAPRIPRPPGAPNIYKVDLITTTSMRMSYTKGADNGASIQKDEVQWATDAAFTDVVWTDIWANGASDPSGRNVALVPGKTYYVRARSYNSAGWGGWSNTGSASTLAALYVSDGAAWRSAEVYVSNGTAWRPPEVLYSKAGAWTTPTSL
ncbi:hypothetical protein QDW23_gp20 [Microbacterium phage Stromboli]|uniref:hypothetical protein n=1 Tax=Microbacterium phage Stromboli TaxID=2713263 RepID=UPI0014173762|nr:hypothetical protein QDW23_gp20 [Microbacterium phage Stromboli]QIN93679.1 hypothetical protein SEA_STROMBOLI_20 [Microbacterium phage Stromboli]